MAFYEEKIAELEHKIAMIQYIINVLQEYDMNY